MRVRTRGSVQKIGVYFICALTWLNSQYGVYVCARVCLCWKDGDECTAYIITLRVCEDHLSALRNDINLKLRTFNICLFVSCINNSSLRRKMFLPSYFFPPSRAGCIDFPMLRIISGLGGSSLCLIYQRAVASEAGVKVLRFNPAVLSPAK